MFSLVYIMLPWMRTRSAGRLVAESQGGGTGSVGNQGNVRSQNGNVVNENIQENVRNVLVNSNRVGCSYKEFLACNPKEMMVKGGCYSLQTRGLGNGVHTRYEWL
ncbi:hypothetical protein Tco_0712209 [Tanacetum coccineum]